MARFSASACQQTGHADESRPLTLATSVGGKSTHLRSHLVNQFLRIPPPSPAGLRADVDEVVRLVVAVAQDLRLSLVQHGEELVVVSLPALRGKLVVESPHTAA